MALPEKIGSYKIVKEIGRGGMGVIYEAVDENNAHFAIKCLPPELKGDGFAELSLSREYDAISALKHPNVISVIFKNRDENIGI